MVSWEEGDLVHRLRLRDEHAFNELVRHWQGRVLEAALERVEDSHLADDVTQEVFVMVFRRADELGPATNLGE